jgi:hypothetical protein
MKNKRKLRTVRPGEVRVGMQVLSCCGALNLAPRRFTVLKVEDKISDEYRDGLFLQDVLLEDANGHGGWETLWDRPEAVGPVWHLDEDVGPAICSARFGSEPYVHEA